MSKNLNERLYEGEPRRFVLERDEDETGVSGTGVVAWGVEFPNGRVVTAWNSRVSQTCVWADMDEVHAVHGHGGRTRVVWLDRDQSDYRHWSAGDGPVPHSHRKESSMRYRSKPSEIEAVQWTGDNYEEIEAFVPDHIRRWPSGRVELLAGKDGAQDWVFLPTNYYVVRQPGDLSDHWPVDADYFVKKYEPV